MKTFTLALFPAACYKQQTVQKGALKEVRGSGRAEMARISGQLTSLCSRFLRAARRAPFSSAGLRW